MVFPQIPIQFRYLAVVMVGLSVFHPHIHNAPGIRLVLFYTIYISVVGLLVVALADDGSASEALYGIRTMSVCVMVMIFATRVNLVGFALLTSAVLAGGFCGMILDVYRGPAWQRMPFPIFSEVNMMMMGSKYLLTERFGGFTFEAGVIGGITAIFMLINFAIFMLGIFEKRLRMPFLVQAIIIASMVLALITIFLSKTKSGLLIVLSGLLAMSFAILFIKRSGPWWIRSLILASVVGVFLCLPVVYRATNNTAMGEYIEKEINNFQLLIGKGVSQDGGAGLKTRIESMKIAVYALPFRPMGAGITNGYFYAQPVLKYIEPTEEMEWFHNMGRYSGYKGAIFNMFSYGGIVALIFLILFFSKIYKGFTAEGTAGGGAVAILLISALIMLGLTVELLPYLEIVTLVLGLGTVVGQQMRDSTPSVGDPHRRPHHVAAGRTPVGIGTAWASGVK